MRMGPYDKKPVGSAFEGLRHGQAPTWASSLLNCIDGSASDPTSRYASLASVGRDGGPRVRHVVLRGCVGDLGAACNGLNRDSIWFVTDRRSAKYFEFRENARFEIAWYFREAREQFRFGGSVLLIDDDDSKLRRLAFETLSAAARVQFFWPQPGAERRPEREIEFQVSQEPSARDVTPENFVVVVIDVRSVDRLILDGSPQNRWIHERDEYGHWTCREVNP
jgi:PPOX class probable FMN-dependent enzyme